MLTWDDVEALASNIPELEFVAGPPRSWNLGKQTLMWERPLSKKDMAALGNAAPTGEVLAIHTKDVGEKFAWIDALLGVCFDSPHFANYPAVLVDLTICSEAQLVELIDSAFEAENKLPG